MKAQIIKNTDREVIISEGDRALVFIFRNGQMTGTKKQNMPYLKTRSDWRFYTRAITKMLEVTKDFYADQNKLPLKGKNDDVPF